MQPIKFENAQVGDEFSFPKNEAVYRKEADFKGKGRLSFVSGCAPHLVGKTAPCTKNRKIILS